MKRTILLATCGVLGGCIIRQQPPQQADPQAAEDTGSKVEYRSWSGPGWYSGVYFTDREAYNRWRRGSRSVNPRPPGSTQRRGEYNRGQRS